VHRTMLAGLGVAAITAGAALWARRRLVLVTVDGSSMEPTLFSGDRVLVHRRGLARVRRGQIVVLEPPAPEGARHAAPWTVTGSAPGWVPATGDSDHRHWNIKRVIALPGDPVPPTVTNVGGVQRVPRGALVVFGDGVASADSRQRGFYFAADILGVVVRRVTAAPRATPWRTSAAAATLEAGATAAVAVTPADVLVAHRSA
jgi:signal peptidase I